MLRIEFLNSAKQGTESHSVLVRELPGVEFGTIPNRIENTVLRFLPGFIKRKLVVGACSLLTVGLLLWICPCVPEHCVPAFSGCI